MELNKIIKDIKCKIIGSKTIEVNGLYHNDKEVKNGGLFFCLNGKKFNGINFIKKAIENGAVAVVVNEEILELKNVVQIIVKNVRRAMSLMASNFYNNPSRKLKVIGVTGTNGKTTTSFMIYDLLKSEGKSCAIIGTNGVCYNNYFTDTGMTTPDPIELQKLFSKFVKNKIEFVVMEVSAHAIFLNKIDGIIFEIVVFTNLTEDHLDYFKTMKKYFKAKEKLFNKKYTKLAVINLDDKYGKVLNDRIKIKKMTYAIKNEADYNIKKIKTINFKQEFLFNNKLYNTKFIGEYNLYNLLSAIIVYKNIIGSLNDLQLKIDKINFVAGRINYKIINGKLFIVDYAHSPDALENILILCSELKLNNKVVCVFGCGGNREAQKRAKMGEISSKYADLTIITVDNSRCEDKLKIAMQIKSGIKNDNYKIILDRKEAIIFAEKYSREGDVILVAGKGNENYIEENGIKIPHNDFEEILKLEKI